MRILTQRKNLYNLKAIRNIYTKLVKEIQNEQSNILNPFVFSCVISS